MKKFRSFLEEAKVDHKTGKKGHYGVTSGLHSMIGKSPADLHAHLQAVKKKHGYESHTVEHGNHISDKYRERHHTELMPGGGEHSKHTLTHPDGHKETLFVDHHQGKIHRIGHHSTVSPGNHDIHVADRTLHYHNGAKKKTTHHTATGMHFEYHD